MIINIFNYFILFKKLKKEFFFLYFIFSYFKLIVFTICNNIFINKYLLLYDLIKHKLIIYKYIRL